MIKISKSSTADTRTCDWTKVTKDQLLESSKQHIEDIHKGFKFFIYLIEKQSALHDLTKISHIDEFHEDFKTGFEKTDWWELHQEKERHHFNNPEFIQDDVNLIDILDQVIDGVMAGLARSGEYRRERLPDGLLEKAYNNTIDLLLKEVEVIK